MINLGGFSPDIIEELDSKGYHILDITRTKDSYPNQFPDFRKLKSIKTGGLYVLRLFVKIRDIVEKIDSGLINVKILSKSGNNYIAEIQTLLPPFFPLSKGEKINITINNILIEHDAAGNHTNSNIPPVC